MLRMDLSMTLEEIRFRDKYREYGFSEAQLSIGGKTAAYGYRHECIFRALRAGCDTVQEVSNWCDTNADIVTDYGS